MDRKQTAQYLDAKKKIYEEYGIAPKHIAKWGEPAEFVQGFMLYIGDGSSEYPSVWPKQIREREGRLSAIFSVRSLSGKDTYEIPASFEIVDYEKEPYLVDFRKELRCDCNHKDQMIYMDIDGPCHHEIAVNIWSENMLLRDSEARKIGREFRHTYDKVKKYVSSPASPWYIDSSVAPILIDEFVRMRKKRVKGLELTKNLCQMFKEHYDGLI